MAIPAIDCPRIVTNTVASAIPGTDIKISTTLMISSDIHGRVTAAAAPISAPTISAKSTDDRPMTREYRAPYITRENTSRPRLSVPNQCSALGDSNFMVISNGLRGEITGARTAHAARRARKISDIREPTDIRDQRRTLTPGLAAASAIFLLPNSIVTPS